MRLNNQQFSKQPGHKRSFLTVSLSILLLSTAHKPVRPEGDEQKLFRRALLNSLTSQVQKRLDLRKYRYPIGASAHQIYADFNNDGQTDVAAIYDVFRPDQKTSTGKEKDKKKTAQRSPENDPRAADENRFLAIGFGANKGRVILKLLKKSILCVGCGGIYGEPDITLEARRNALSASVYGGSAWRWFEKDIMRYEGGRFKLIGKQHTWYHNGGAYFLDVDTNLNTLEGLRKSSEDDKGVRYKNFIANEVRRPLRIDGNLNEADWRSANFIKVSHSRYVVHGLNNRASLADLQYKAALLYGPAGLYIAVDVDDNRLIGLKTRRGRTPDKKTLLKRDHVELWLDFSRSLENPAFEGGGASGQGEMHRRKPDGAVFQFAFALPARGTRAPSILLLPEKSRAPVGIRSAIKRRRGGYRLEALLPQSFINTQISHDDLDRRIPWKAYTQFGLSIAVSDTDLSRKPAQDTIMATSELQWGSPFTFGAANLWKGRYKKLDYPSDKFKVRL